MRRSGSSVFCLLSEASVVADFDFFFFTFKTFNKYKNQIELKERKHKDNMKLKHNDSPLITF